MKHILKKKPVCLPALTLAFSLLLSSVFCACDSDKKSGSSSAEAESTSAQESTASYEDTDEDTTEPGHAVMTVTEYPSRGIWVASTFALNTYISLTFYNEKDAALADGCADLLNRYELLLSRTIETSEISQLNARKITEVSDDTAELIQKGLYYSELSGGAYDVAIATITSLWDFLADDPVVPDADSITEALKWVDYTAVHEDGNTITFDNDYTGLDLGSIAKGFIADKLAAYLEENGVTNAILSLGGNLVLIGSKTDGTDFSAGIQLPFGDTGYDYFCVLKASNCSIVTSGVYERYFKGADGKWYHHILNPKTGYSYDNGIYSVTIIGPCSADCDALSTTLFSLGKEEGMKLIDTIDDYYAIFYMSDGSIYLSEGLTDAYSYEEKEHEYYTFDNPSFFASLQ